MSIQVVVNAVLIIALVGWIAYRQLTWRPIDPGRMWRMPAILAIVGLVTISSMTKVHLLTAVDIAVLLIEIVISLGLGALMGAIAVIRPMSDTAIDAYAAHQRDRDRGRRPLSVVTLETRTGWFGLALWVLLIAVRVGIDALATMAGSELAASTGVILIMVAANRAARVAMIAHKSSSLATPAV